MEYELQLKIQAYLDGELSGKEAAQVEELLINDEEAKALLAELESTGAALTDFDLDTRLPESREFFWSKIQREISRQGRPEAVAEPESIWTAWRRILAPVGAMAGIVIALLIAVISMPRSSATSSQSSLTDPGTFTYRDYESGATLVWLSYPAENDFAQEEGAGTFE